LPTGPEHATVGLAALTQPGQSSSLVMKEPGVRIPQAALYRDSNLEKYMKLSDTQIQEALNTGGLIQLPGYSDQMAVLKSGNDGKYYFCNPENFSDPQHLMDVADLESHDDWTVYKQPSAR
jgi:hypothetical protein